MSGILQDSSPQALIAGIEANLFAWIPVFGSLGYAYVDKPPGVIRSITNIPSSLFNSVMDARLAPDQMDEAIRYIVSDAGGRKVPLLWWTGPSTQPDDLGKYLERHGFVLDEEGPGMAVDLDHINWSLAQPAGLSVHPARKEADFTEWTMVMFSGFGADSPAEHSVNAWCSILSQAKPGTLLAYTGRYDDKPVASAMLFLAAGVAGIYSVATIPKARRKGIGAWMTLHALREARSLGYQFGVLQSSEMGLNVYRSLGFREYCRICDYLWKPDK